MRQDHGRPERFRRDHADDGLHQALAGGTAAAIAAAVIRIRDDEATAFHQLRALRP